MEMFLQRGRSAAEKWAGPKGCLTGLQGKSKSLPGVAYGWKGQTFAAGAYAQMEKHSLGIRQEVAALSSDAPMSASSCWDHVCPCNCKAG